MMKPQFFDSNNVLKIIKKIVEYANSGQTITLSKKSDFIFHHRRPTAKNIIILKLQLSKCLGNFKCD